MAGRRGGRRGAGAGDEAVGQGRPTSAGAQRSSSELRASAHARRQALATAWCDHGRHGARAAPATGDVRQGRGRRLCRSKEEAAMREGSEVRSSPTRTAAEVVGEGQGGRV